jgi:protocatechuate 3,4-dioxygenase beta subunit
VFFDGFKSNLPGIHYNESMSTGKSSIHKSENLTSSSRFSGTITSELMEGPYYKPGSPERTGLFEAGIPGDKLTLTGYVFNIKGQPVIHAWLDFWQADRRGEYDISGYTLRGHQYTDNSGKYRLKTVVPGQYFSRAPHIHVKVQSHLGGPVLTTQLFFPGLASNKTDPLFREDLLTDLAAAPGGNEATFNFTLKE